MTAEIIYVNFGRPRVVRRQVRNLWDDLGQDPVLDAAVKARIAEINREIDETVRRLGEIRP